MNHRIVKKTAATLCTLAYLWVGLGVGSQFVYCVGSDGHSGIERTHDASHGLTPVGAASLVGPESCTDIPLLTAASKEREKLSNVHASLYSGIARILSRASLSDPRFVAYRSNAKGERDPSLLTTVLRV
jgi:hypothetical protein